MVDELLASFKRDFAVSEGTSIHPRFAQYKNHGRVENEQDRRRFEFLNRQKEARFDHANHARKLALNEFDEDDDESMETSTASSTPETTPSPRPSRNRYKNQLMLSEWLVDIPEELSDAWVMLPCPVGRRCLVVASRGVTTAYDKAGRKTKQFQSFFPGGSRSSRSGYSIVDCVFNESQSTFYCLDLIAINNQTYSDTEVECRRFILKSQVEENANFREVCPRTNPYRFIVLPHCNCEKMEMETMMIQPFDFELDGLLFYHKQGHYFHGATPLVGWLKPFMLPEVIGVAVPEAMRSTTLAREFIDEFNQRTGHRSSVQQSGTITPPHPN